MSLVCDKNTNNIIYNLCTRTNRVYSICNKCPHYMVASSFHHLNSFFTSFTIGGRANKFSKGIANVLFEILSKDLIRPIIYVNDIYVCPIKKLPSYNITTLPCNHSFDTDSIMDWLKKSQKCPLDDIPIDDITLSTLTPNESLSQQTKKKMKELNESFYNNIHEHYQNLLTTIEKIKQLLYQETEIYSNRDLLLLIDRVYPNMDPDLDSSYISGHNSFYCKGCKSYRYDRKLYSALNFIKNILTIPLSINNIHKYSIILALHEGRNEINCLLDNRLIKFNPNYFHQYPTEIQDLVHILIMIQQLCNDNILSALPFELIYEIVSWC